MGSYVFDTDVACDILAGESFAVQLLDLLQTDESHRIFISEMTRGELLSTKNLTKDMEQDIDNLVECFDEVITVDETISRKVAELRRKSNGPTNHCSTCNRRTAGRLKMPDSIVAATAYTEDAVLITRNYQDYQRLSEQELLTVMETQQAIALLLNSDAAISAKNTD